jgi:hypothetical protein
MNRDVFLSILAMDSYSRGYRQGINLESSNGTRIGNATILNQSETLGISPEVQASFYGIAYTMTGASGFNSGERVIAYRGTDDLGAESWNPSDWLLGSDVWNGWGVGAGSSPSSTQARLAVEFYKSVVGAANDNVNPYFHSRFLRAA